MPAMWPARLEDGTVIHNFYVPAGGDVPDREREREVRSEARLPRPKCATGSARSRPETAILVGDLNIAPREDDVWCTSSS